MVSTNVNQMTENVINGTFDYMTEDPVGDLLPQVEAKYKDRFLIGPGYPNTYYFFMNSTIPPFNNLAARQAVNYAIDSRCAPAHLRRPAAPDVQPAAAGDGRLPADHALPVAAQRHTGTSPRQSRSCNRPTWREPR